MGAIETVADAITDNRTYYNCPGCGREVWAYGSYVGNLCWKCPGTIGHGIIKTTDNVTFGLTSTAIDAVIDNKTEYRCPRCGVKKWAYGAGIGRTCLKCQEKSVENFIRGKPFEKDWFDMHEASEKEVSLKDFLQNYYDKSGTVVTINGQTFSNVIPKSMLSKAANYKSVSTSWCCGNNAINICLKMHGYSKQLSESEYKYNKSFGCGWSYENFYSKNIVPHFNYHGWEGTESLALEPEINWSYIDNTDFTNWSLIILGGNDICAHYTIVLGVDTKKSLYLVTDQALNIWLVDMSLFRKISTYKLSKSINVYQQHSVYRVG